MIALIVIIGTVGIRVLDTTINRYSDDVMSRVDMENLASDILGEILFISGTQKDFVAFHDMELVNDSRQRIAAARKYIEEMIRKAANPDEAASGNLFLEDMDDYSENFERLIELVTERGLNEDEGIRGRFRDAAHSFEAAVKTTPVKNGTELYLMARRHEKDYIIRGTTKYIERMEDVLGQLRENIDAADIPRSVKSRFHSYLDAYQDGFNDLVNADNEIKVLLIALEENSSSTIDRAKMVLSDAREQSGAGLLSINSSADRSRVILLITTAAAVLIAVTISILLTGMITRPLLDLVRHARAIAMGDLDRKVKISRSDELGQLAEDFRRMIEMLRGKAKIADRIAGGDLGEDVDIAGELDLLGRSMQQMLESLRQQKASIEHSMAEAAENQRFLDEASPVLNSAAGNNLTGRIKGEYHGNLSRMKEDINDTLKSLDRALTQVFRSVEEVKYVSGQISSGSRDLAERASQQAGALEKVTGSLDQITSNTRYNADNTEAAKNLSQEAVKVAAGGNESIRQLNEAIERIKVASDQTSTIVQTIDEIAFQTNILSLNAAVEAARAGEAGKGFAVVAQEVRELANRSAQAARKTSKTIEEAISAAEQGVQITEKVAVAFSEISDGNKQVNELIALIADAANDQAKRVEEISQAIIRMDGITQQNATNAEESASAADALNGQTGQLHGMFSAFKLSAGNNGKFSGRISDGRKATARLASGYPEEVNKKSDDELKIDPDQIVHIEDADF